jgi:outer membrane receptor protein involved in Fe transport
MKIKLLFFAILLFSSSLINAQITVRGIVKDADAGTPLPGAMIRVNDSSTGTTTNTDGEFTLQLSSLENIVLTTTFLGYGKQETRVLSAGEVLVILLNPEVRMLGTAIVTATRNRRDMYEVPVRVDIVSREQTEAMPALSADDYLRMIPGISVSRGSSFLGSATVSMRGMGSEAGRTLVMIDGVPVNKTDGGTVNWNAINAYDVEQVEVMKGPGSSIHGGNALGGVINLITPAPSKDIEGAISQTYGTFQTSNTDARIGGRNKDFFWGINGRYRLSDGYITTPADEVSEYSVASFLDEYQVGGRAGYFINPRQILETSLSYYQGQRGTGAKYTGYGFENDALAAPAGAFNEYTAMNGRLVYKGSVNETTNFNVTLYGQRENYVNIRESIRNQRITRYDVESVRDDLGLLSSFSFKPLASHTVTTGLDIRHGAVDGADIYLTTADKVFNLGKMNQLGIYLQDEITLGHTPWSILAGIRFDYAGFYDGAFLVENPTNETAFLQAFGGELADADFSAFSPRLSVQYHIPRSYRVYAGYSRGFRAPVLDDMCRTGRISGGMKIANPNLKPEYLDNFEIGGDVFVTPRITLSPSVYYSLGADFHAYISTGDSLVMNNRKRPIRIKDNIGKVEILGAEMAARFNITKGLQWGISYSYNDTKISEFLVLDPEKDEDLVGKQLVYQPRDIFNTSVLWRNPYVNVMLAYNYKGSQWLNDVNTEQIESFNFIDLHLWRPVFRGLSVAVKIHNLLDQDFVDSRNMIAPARMINAELRYSF